MQIDMVGERCDCSGIASIDDEHDATRINVDEQRNLVETAPCRGLVDADTAQRRQIHARTGGGDVVEDDAP